MKRVYAVGVAVTLLSLASGCAMRSTDVAAKAADPRVFSTWECPRIFRELDAVQRSATRMAYALDERAGNNIIAMSLGMTVFWPALLAMRPTEPEALELAELKGRFEALRQAARQRACTDTLSAAELAQLAVRQADILTYEQRSGTRGAARHWSLTVGAVTRQGLELGSPTEAGNDPSVWEFDRQGNLLKAPLGPVWPQLLRGELALGTLVSGELTDPTDPRLRARVRGQVVAVGPQTIGDRTMDAVIIDLFGDAQSESESGRLDGVLVVDRSTGLLIRLDLASPQAAFHLQRRLIRIQAKR